MDFNICRVVAKENPDTQDIIAENFPITLKSDRRGNLFVKTVAVVGTDASGNTLATITVLPVGDINELAGNFNAAVGLSTTYGFSANVNSWVPISSWDVSFDITPLAIEDSIGVVAFNYGLDPISGNWTRLVSANSSVNITPTGNVDVQQTAALEYLWDEVNSVWVQKKANSELTLLASAARTVETNSVDQTNFNFRGTHVEINVTAQPGLGGITPVIQGKDPVSGTYYDILVGTAITTVGITILKIYPGIGAIANGAASDILPRTWRFQMRVATADSYTYSVGASPLI